MTTPGWTARLPRLSGELVDVREVEAGDAPALFELLSDPAVVRHVSPPPPSLRAFEGFIAWAQQQRAQAKSVCFAIVPHGLERAVGLIQVRALEPTFFTAEWGFAIGQAFWGTEAFPDAARLVARFAFETLHVHRLEARAAIGNERGGGVLNKLGARPEATLSRSFARDGSYHEQLLWSLAAEDCQQALTRSRFEASAATARIAQAVDALRAQQQAERPASSGAPALYPFFLTDPTRRTDN